MMKFLKDKDYSNDLCLKKQKFYNSASEEIFPLHCWAVKEEDLEDFLFTYYDREFEEVFPPESSFIYSQDWDKVNKLLCDLGYKTIPELREFNPETDCLQTKSRQGKNAFGDYVGFEYTEFVTVSQILIFTEQPESVELVVSASFTDDLNGHFVPYFEGEVLSNCIF